jgi:hypothetical protein
VACRYTDCANAAHKSRKRNGEDKGKTEEIKEVEKIKEERWIEQKENDRIRRNEITKKKNAEGKKKMWQEINKERKYMQIENKQ